MTRARDVANLIGSGNFSSTTFTATAGQTAFTISHTQGFVQVFMNGLLLDLTTDYTSNGSAITLTSGAAAGDEIEVVKYNTFSVGDAQTQTQADARYAPISGAYGDTDVDAHLLTAGVTLDATNDRVGMGGVTSPSIPLEVKGRSADGRFLRGLDNGGTDMLDFGHNGTEAFIDVTHSGGAFSDLAFKTTSTERMRIHEEGYITKSNQPAFYMKNTTDSTRWKGGTVYINRGNHWNNTTGTFTAPVAGAYQFGAFGQSNAGTFYILAYHNGNSIGAWYDSAGSGYKHASLTVIANMAANDTFYIGNANINTGGQNGMFGHFLG